MSRGQEGESIRLELELKLLAQVARRDLLNYGCENNYKETLNEIISFVLIPTHPTPQMRPLLSL